MVSAHAAAARPARLWEIDALRGVAVLAMIYFHFMWDLMFFGLTGVNVFSAPWQTFARSIGTTFTFLMGLSLTLTDARLHAAGQPARRPLVVRGLWIFGWGMVLTAITLVALPASPILFGILHMLGAAMLLATLFLGMPAVVPALVGLVLVALGSWLNTLSAPFPWLIWLGLAPAGLAMADYYPLLPWGGVALLGVAAGKWLYPQGRRAFPLPDFGPATAPLRLLGRHSLLIYLVHQPILYALIWLALSTR